MLAKARNGGTFVLKGYVSTSVTKKPVFGGNFEFHIEACHGLDLFPVSLFPEERELLLNHNCHYYFNRLRKVGTKYIVECTQLPPRKRPSVGADRVAVALMAALPFKQ
jgi:hypothetical protein